ncbi:hypothetical protein EYF80_007981 [Liparis tanakae]|uniref:Uncharacterized protein n=1 Tax=Liparis tanakae TaxID=230148 RepID=A0A4Z2IX33_9TELE|nr:hypothetical protein EYF80_007981 [Liparis tanakae]
MQPVYPQDSSTQCVHSGASAVIWAPLWTSALLTVRGLSHIHPPPSASLRASVEIRSSLSESLGGSSGVPSALSGCL